MIRSLEPDDFEAWHPLWQGYQRFYKADISDEISASTWKRLHERSEPVFGAIAFDGTRPVGIVHYLYHRSTWSIGDYCYLQDLFVLEAARGKGFGRQLIQFVYDAASDKGASRVYWLTHETNQTAMRLYDRVADKTGFVQYRKMMPVKG
jgi:GNAT superfamily N-acetyltransferase